MSLFSQAGSQVRKWLAQEANRGEAASGRTGRHGRRRALSIDPLEDRRLLALTYVLTPLPDLAGGAVSSAANAINNSLMVAGTGTIASNNERATLWDAEEQTITSTNIGTLSGKTQSQATGINDAGYVVGRSGASKTGDQSSQANGDRAFIWNPNTQTFTNLGDLAGGDDWSAAVDINSANQVAGTSGAGNFSHAFIWGEANRNEVQQIAITGTPTSGTFQLKIFNVTSVAIPYNATASQVQTAIRGMSNIGANNANVTGGPGPGTPWVVTFVGQRANMNIQQMQVVNSTLDGGATVDVTTTTQGSKLGLTDIGDLSGGLDISLATGMNNAGVVVGAGSVGSSLDPDINAFVWDPVRGIRSLGAPSISGDNDYSLASDINDLGVAIGQALDQTSGLAAVIWDTNATTPFSTITGLPPLMEDGSPAHNSLGTAINNFGVGVGTTKLPISGVNNAWVWIPGRGTFNLNDAVDSSGTGWVLNSATDINDLGIIVGNGLNPQGQNQGFVLTPVNNRPSLPYAPHLYVNQGSTLNYTITATDPNNDTLTYSLENAPAGMTINPTTGQITWTPSASDPAEVAVTVVVADDGWLTLEDRRTVNVGVNRSSTFYDNFDAGLNGSFWTTTSTGQGQAAVILGTSVEPGGRSLRFRSSGGDAVKDLAAATLTVNLSSLSDATLTFQQFEGSYGTANDDEPDPLSDAFLLTDPGALGDGVAISSNGVNWYRLIDITGQDMTNRQGDGLWRLMEYDLGDNIQRINTQFGAGLTFNSSFKIRFSQYGLANVPVDGFYVDDVRIHNQGLFFSPTLPTGVFQVADTADPDLSYRIGVFGTVNASTPIIVATHGAGREIGAMTTYWQNYIANPANGITGAIVLAPFFAAGGRYDDYGRLSWNTSNDAAADLALLNIITEVTATGIGNPNDLRMFGFSRGAHFAENFAYAHPDRVNAIVAASADRQTFPLDNVIFPYGAQLTALFPAPAGTTTNQAGTAFDVPAFLQSRIMLWVGQNDTTPEDTSEFGNAQGLTRRERSANMYTALGLAAAGASLPAGSFDYELFVKEAQGHIFNPDDIGTFYSFLFGTTPAANSEVKVYGVPVYVPTTTERSGSLPSPVGTVTKNTDFYVEFWVQAPGATGIAGGSVSLAYDTAILNSSTGNITPGSVFPNSRTGTVNDANGRVTSLGGSTGLSGVGVGEYALLGRVKFTALTDATTPRQIFAALQGGSVSFTLQGGGAVSSQLVPFPFLQLDSLNNPPTAGAGGPYVINEGQSLNLAGSGTDADVGDTLTYSWDVNGDGVYGDATGQNPSVTPVQLAVLGINNGTNYQVRVLVSDGKAQVVSSATTLTMNNVAPTANAGGPYTIAEGQNLVLNGSGSSDPNLLDVLTYSWDVNGDGTFGDATGVSPTITWAQLVAYGFGEGPTSISNVRVRVSDGVSTVTSAATTVTINNAGPTVAGSGTGGYRGEVRSFTFTATDPSTVDQGFNFTYNIDWDGNGSVDQTVVGPGSGVNVTRSFFTAGVTTVKVSATDRQSATGPVTNYPVTTSEYVLRDDGTGKIDLIWGGTNGLDGVFFFTGVSNSVTVFVQLENTTLVNRTSIVSGVTGKVIAYGYDNNDGLIAEFLTTRQVVLYGGNGGDTLVGGFLGDTLDGGEGNDLLIGGTQGADGNDSLFGGNGKDILIGHRGADLLDAGAGEDLLVSGIVQLSPNYPTAIFSIQNEWNSTRAYPDRVANISGTGSGPRLNGNFFLQAGVTVLNDNAVDTLVGGADLDWFLYSIAQDLLNDGDPSETKTNVP